MHIKNAIAVMGATMEGCDRAFPVAQGVYSLAFKSWRILGYKVPGLVDLPAERTPDLANARAAVAGDFHGPVDDQSIQCHEYGSRLQHQELLFPPEMLAPFAPGK